MGVVTLEARGDIVVIRVNNPPVNALSQELRAGLMDAAAKVEADTAIKAAVLICEGRTFIPGADIREFNNAPKEPNLPATINLIEASSKPWIAAMHGSALGGGLELALGCHYRVVVSSTTVGLPEVNLGILPGAGGTIRLPRATDLEFALEMITTGKPVKAEAAFKAGIIDAIVPEDQGLEAFAVSFAENAKAQSLPLPLSSRAPKTVPNEDWWKQKLAEIKKKAKGQLSPVEAAKIIKNGLQKPFLEALAEERSCFTRLKEGEQSKAMRYAFFSEREIAKVPFAKDVKAVDVSNIVVVGGGTMGAGIAVAALLNGCSVSMIERNKELTEAGKHRVMTILDSSFKRGLISKHRREELEGKFSSVTGYDREWNTELVIEAAFEDMAVKKTVFSKLDEVMPKNCIFATNSSYLDINEIAAAVADSSRVLGLHFFSPAHIMKLVEVIRTDTVSPEVYATGLAFAKKLRKKPIYSGVCDGFIGNRIIYEYRKACDYMLEDGALPHEIDAAMREFGMAMGPYEMGDMAGLDIGWSTRKRRALTRDPGERYVKIADRICELGRFGQKTGSGWYDYSSGNRKGEIDPVVEKIILEESEARGITRRSFTPENIQNTVVQTMAIEGQKIIAEGIALRGSDIDIIMVFGYSFPRWRGGPMFMAEQELI